MQQGRFDQAATAADQADRIAILNERGDIAALNKFIRNH
jgi:hypothetical protein